MSIFKRLRYYYIVAMIVFPLLVTISMVQRKLNHIIVAHKLTDTEPIKNAPPVVAFTTIVLGSFRGLVADVLWLRTIALQDQGRYYEMVQLASWIVKLQPRFTGATAYLAWNMAYNISVTCSSFEDRWRWVQQGIELIRNEALDYNPGDPTLYKELGWIYQHKIGNIMDDANIYYKNQLALALMKAFGQADPDWHQLKQAPKKLSEVKAYIKKNYPDFQMKMEQAKNNKLAELVESSKSKANSEDKTKQKSLIEVTYSSLSNLELAFRTNGQLPEALTKLLSKEENDYLTNYFRAHWLRSFYKLYPEEIIEINDKYGKLDWRLPESQAIYWATLGIKHSADKKDLNCERMITQSLKDSFMAGRLLFFDTKDFKRILTIPNLNVVDATRQCYLDTSEKNQDTQSFKSALENFMKDAIVNLYSFGRFSKAQEYYQLLRKDHPTNVNYRVSLSRFIEKEWREDIKDATPKQAYSIITGLFYQSYYFLAQGDYELYEGFQRRGIFIYNYYKKENKDSWDRVGLPDLPKTKQKIIEGCYKTFNDVMANNLKFEIAKQNTENEEEKQ